MSYALYSKLMDHNIPAQFLKLLINWYSTCKCFCGSMEQCTVICLNCLVVSDRVHWVSSVRF